MTKATQTKLQKKVSEIVNNESILDTLFNLKNRWADEKEYEDWKDYENQMIGLTSYEFVKSTKRPFGFIIKIENTKIQIFIKIKGNSMNLAAK